MSYDFLKDTILFEVNSFSFLHGQITRQAYREHSVQEKFDITAVICQLLISTLLNYIIRYIPLLSVLYN